MRRRSFSTRTRRPVVTRAYPMTKGRSADPAPSTVGLDSRRSATCSRHTPAASRSLRHGSFLFEPDLRLAPNTETVAARRRPSPLTRLA